MLTKATFNKYECFFCILFITCCVFSNYKIFSVISIALLVIYVLLLFFDKPVYMAKYFVILFSCASQLLGLMAIEFGDFYLPELVCYSHFAGSIPLFIFIHWIMLFICRCYDLTYEKDDHPELVQFDDKGLFFLKVCTGVSFVIYALLMISVIRVTPSFVLGVDRFEYASYYSVSGIFSILNNISAIFLLFPLLLLIEGERVSEKLAGIITVGIYILYYFWIGNKFTPFLTVLLVFLLLYCSKLLKIDLQKARTVLVQVVVVLGVMVIFGVGMAQTLGNVGDTVSSYLSERVAQQGQLWWRTYDEAGVDYHPDEYVNEIDALFNADDNIAENIGSDYGIYKVMYYCAPDDVVDSKLSTGSRYTAAGLPLYYYYFGPIGVTVFAAIVGLLFAVFINAFIKAVSNCDFVKALIYLRFFMILRTGFGMGLFLDFVDPISICSYIYLIVMHGRTFYLTDWQSLKIERTTRDVKKSLQTKPGIVTPAK